MTVDELITLRKAMHLSQTEMADLVGLKLRAYQNIESKAAAFRQANQIAFERIALSYAIAAGDPMIAPEAIRKDALTFARMIAG